MVYIKYIRLIANKKELGLHEYRMPTFIINMNRLILIFQSFHLCASYPFQPQYVQVYSFSLPEDTFHLDFASVSLKEAIVSRRT